MSIGDHKESTNWQDPLTENSWIEYPVQAFTMLDGDENPWNDNKWKLVDIYYPWMDDVAPIALSGPATGPAQTFGVEATVKNVGQNTECCFKTYVAIAEVDYANAQQLFYDDFINKSFPVSKKLVGNHIEVVQITYAAIENKAALHLIDKAKDLMRSSLSLFDRGIEVLKPY